jgi:hypothetical protein
LTACIRSTPLLPAIMGTFPRKTTSHNEYMTRGIKLPRSTALRVRVAFLPKYLSSVGTTFWAPNERMPTDTPPGQIAAFFQGSSVRSMQ